MVPDFVTQLHEARRRSGHTCRSLGAEIGRTYETVSRVEREGKGNFDTLDRIAQRLGFKVCLFTAEGKLLTMALDAPHIGEQLYRYRRDVLRKPRKAYVRRDLSREAIAAIEHAPAFVRFCTIEQYASDMGLRLGLIKKLMTEV